MKNVGIFGIGAIGSVLTKYITRNKTNRYFFFNRTEKDTITISFSGQEDTLPIQLSTHINQKLDWLIVCLKEYQVESASPKLKALISENTKVAIFQNGINLSSRYSQIANQNNILETIIDCSVQKLESHKLLQIRTPKIILPEKQIAQEFIQLFNVSGSKSEIKFVTTERFIESQWTKLIESSAIGSVQSYTEKPCSIFQNQQYLNEFMELVEEGIKVALSEGVELSVDLNEQLLSKLKNYPSAKGSSMLTDKLAGNQLELDAKIGAILKIAIKNKVDVPTTQMIYNSLLD